MGLTTIRTANKNEILNNEFYVHSDYHTRAQSAFYGINRWLAVRLGMFYKNVVLVFVNINTKL